MSHTTQTNFGAPHDDEDGLGFYRGLVSVTVLYFFVAILAWIFC